MTRAEGVARAFLDGFVAGEEEAITATLADDAALVLPRPSWTGTTISGKANLAAAMLRIREQYVSPQPTYGMVLADENSAAVEWRLTATLRRNGAAYDQFYAWFFEVPEGRIVEIREFIDTEYGMRVHGDSAISTVKAHANQPQE